MGVIIEPIHRLSGFATRPIDVARGLRRSHVWPDLQAGMTIAAVAIPHLTHCLDVRRGVDVERAQDIIRDQGTLVLDVREPEEFDKGHLPAARLLPLRCLLDEAETLPRAGDILLVCRSGRRSLRAVHMLRGLGFENMHNLEGGILSWRAEGLPVAMGRAEQARLGPNGQ